MHVTYEIRKFMTTVDLRANRNPGRAAVVLIEKYITDLQEEEKAIVQVCASLSHFLRVNALNPINDDIFEYLEHFLREERMKRAAGATNESVVAGLEQLLVDYQCENKLIDAVMKIDAGEIGKPPTLQAIRLQVTRLYRLPINGMRIEEQVKQLIHVENRFHRDREQTVDLPMRASFSLMMRKLRAIVM